ncbi:hypothetical protein [Streptomyces griseosporeus]|uniref:hypothetical protein n=1 Tax=Streptomyces griseosporeus TaxID=1910 RepID=UPI00167C662A|nr:hypothetical protein [Streptomyces griseosporeus]GHF79353.1 hypothetical protein GCM10018783_57130 [Streptomyces griseosporeus]
MGNLYAYFSAPGDDTALTAHGLDGGPEAAGFPTLLVKGVDPYVQLGAVESLLTEVPYDDIVERPRFNDLLSSPEADSRWLLTLTDELRDALATAPPERLRQTAPHWARIEEFGGEADPEDLAVFLTNLAALATGARKAGEHLYCLVTL